MDSASGSALSEGRNPNQIRQINSRKAKLILNAKVSIEAFIYDVRGVRVWQWAQRS
jgi:hypothetical protein